ncbi:ceramidase domain-containing protein [Micromonospora sp. NPDC000089]|uniref:ceramidase domain-containing protein n=1 Tax=unclassified Micromonospora TaxID=2617518 RepID=UPI0036B2DFA3
MYIDSYWERTAPGLWGEPANAVTNVAFLLASGVLIWLLAGQRRAVPASLRLLPYLLGVVGLCSLAFHLLATRATAALDSLSILLFILAAVVLLAHHMWGLPWRRAWWAAPGYVAFAIGTTAALAAVGGERAVLGGYVPALVSLLVLAGLLRWTAPAPARRYAGWLLVAAGIFTVSLTLRTLDGPLCGRLPIGTHFPWHCLNAAVLFIVAYAVVHRWQWNRTG